MTTPPIDAGGRVEVKRGVETCQYSSLESTKKKITPGIVKYYPKDASEIGKR